MKNTVEIQIPFAGFYITLHSSEAEHEIQSMVDWYCEDVGEDMPESLVKRLEDTADFNNFNLQYAKAYTEAFCDEYLMGFGQFTEMTSPKFYNFETDRLFMRLPLEMVMTMFANLDKDTLTRVSKERHTSYDGFCSHYSPRWKEWGNVEDWDHNQLATLLVAHLEEENGEEWDIWKEYSLVEDLSEYEHISDWLWNSEEASKAINLVHYLRERAERPIKTMREWYKANTKPFSSTPLGEYVPAEL